MNVMMADPFAHTKLGIKTRLAAFRAELALLGGRVLPQLTHDELEIEFPDCARVEVLALLRKHGMIR